LKPIAALIAVLVAFLGWESLPASGDPPKMQPAATRLASAAPSMAQRPVAAWTSMVLARPLFARDRRPSVPGMPIRSHAPDTLPRLAGTVRSNDSLQAIFVLADHPRVNPIRDNPTQGGSPPNGTTPNGTTPDASEKPIVVGRGGIVAAWTVIDISDGVVALERDGRSVTLRLSYANTPVAAHIAAPEALVLLHDKRTNPFLQP
jgi:hypothetical protein